MIAEAGVEVEGAVEKAAAEESELVPRGGFEQAVGAGAAGVQMVELGSVRTGSVAAAARMQAGMAAAGGTAAHTLPAVQAEGTVSAGLGPLAASPPDTSDTQRYAARCGCDIRPCASSTSDRGCLGAADAHSCPSRASSSSVRRCHRLSTVAESGQWRWPALRWRRRSGIRSRKVWQVGGRAVSAGACRRGFWKGGSRRHCRLLAYLRYLRSLQGWRGCSARLATVWPSSQPEFHLHSAAAVERMTCPAPLA